MPRQFIWLVPLLQSGAILHRAGVVFPLDERMRLPSLAIKKNTPAPGHGQE